MRNIILALAMMAVSAGVLADQQSSAYTDEKNDEVMAKVYGTCTKATCPPGTKVVVDAKEGDSGTAISSSGGSYDLLQLKDREFVIIDNTSQTQPDAKVRDKNGSVYYIQRMFLKKH